jgi:hypothetical protein
VTREAQRTQSASTDTPVEHATASTPTLLAGVQRSVPVTGSRGACDSVYTDTAGGGCRAKGGRDRGETAYAGAAYAFMNLVFASLYQGI